MKKIGLTEWYLPVSGPDAIRLCRKLGLDGIQITDIGGADRNYPLLDPRVQELYKEAVNETGVEIYTLHPLHIAREPGIQHDVNSSVGQATLEMFKKTVDSCKALNIPTIMLASFSRSKFSNVYEYKNTINTLSLYNKIAEDNGLRLIYEGFSDTDTVKEICKKTGGLTICYDLANPWMFGFSTPKKDIESFDISMIDCVHVKDTVEQMNKTCKLGSGVAGVKESLRMLNERGFDGYYILETHYIEFINDNHGYGMNLLLEDAEFVKANW